MTIGNDDDFNDEIDDVTQTNEPELDIDDDVLETPDNPQPEGQVEDDFTTYLLKSRGIEDKSKIKFENEEGTVEEVDWDSLSNQDKLNILSSSESTEEDKLDDAEIQLINTIRQSGMNPQEYLQYMGKEEVQRYIQNAEQPHYEIDNYTDDELFLMDFMSRMGDITEDEAAEALERAKTNEGLFKKQIDAIRNEYKRAEQENQMQAKLEQDQLAQQQYEEFSNKIVDEINSLTEIQGFDLNMNEEDMQMLYDFITGKDAAGHNYMAKALSDPRILVKTAWLALNGDQMVSDITKYFQKEIANVRKESYNKGVQDAQKDKTNNVVFKQKSKSAIEEYDDLDDF